MSDWLIDTGGNVCLANSPELRRKLWSRQPAADFSRYVVTNMGYAQVSCGFRAIGVRWRPTNLTRQTLITLVQVLRDQDEQRVILSTLRDDWSDAICGTLGQAQDAILAEFETASCDVGGYFEAVACTPERLSKRGRLAGVLASARAANHRFAPHSLWQMLEGNSAGRYILTEPQGEDGPLKIVACGNGYDSMTPDWLARAPGRYLEEQPDANYARRGSRGYRTVAAASAPLIEDVEASTWWPGRGRMKLSYTRLLLPIFMQDGRRFVLSTAEANGIG